MFSRVGKAVGVSMSIIDRLGLTHRMLWYQQTTTVENQDGRAVGPRNTLLPPSWDVYLQECSNLTIRTTSTRIHEMVYGPDYGRAGLLDTITLSKETKELLQSIKDGQIPNIEPLLGMEPSKQKRKHSPSYSESPFAFIPTETAHSNKKSKV